VSATASPATGAARATAWPRQGPGAGALHVAIDDASRLASTEILPDEKKTSATAFLVQALGFFKRHGIKVERVMTDNGSADKSRSFPKALADRDIRHKRTRPYTPRTNAKAERFIQTLLREWIYAAPYQNSPTRAAAMPAWLCNYNTKRPHAALGGKPPISKLTDNLRANDI
jgi:transposase InsO family protein